ncbi:MAG: hypothetical protein GF344_00605 [Chitinivibrionales bacterium]|nr:hypothetical protein [Chitinivibrionales bacterium]MBD3355621.1 hypothetical protein [Chitinivibrionales bacterium]
MDKDYAVKQRSLGEAHLYVAVAKADGVVSERERRSASHLARKSQEVLDVLKLNEKIRNLVGDDVRTLLSDPAFDGWNAERHLDQAIEHLSRAKSAGAWDIELTAHKNEQGLLELAQSDGYVFKESRLLREIEKRLNALA